jgi:Ca2+/Na+ antiporter
MAAMAGATLGFGGLLAFNALTPLAGIGMVGLAAAYLGANYLIARKDSKALDIPIDKLIHDHSHCSGHGHDHHHSHAPKKNQALPQGAWAAAGLGSLVLAADMVVGSASTVAANTGVSQGLIGALAVALGTSLPEFVINIQAARRGNTEMAVGNVLGCNIFNILFVGGVLSLAGAGVPPAFGPGTSFGLFNLAALGASAGLMTATLATNKGGIKKWQGYAALGLYAGYCAATAALGGYQHGIAEKAPGPAIIAGAQENPVPSKLKPLIR